MTSKLALPSLISKLDHRFRVLAHNMKLNPFSDHLHDSVLHELLVECKLPLKFIADGAFREAYKIVGTPYVIKIPSSNRRVYIEHGQADINAYKLIMDDPKMKSLRKYLPTMHYSQYELGIVLTEYVRPLSKEYDSDRQWSYRGKYRADIEKASRLVSKFSKAKGGDHDLDLSKMENFGTVDGKLKILDLGCFTGESC
jgi:hypothetical protein